MEPKTPSEGINDLLTAINGEPFNGILMVFNGAKTPYKGITAINGEFLKRQFADLRLAAAKRHR